MDEADWRKVDYMGRGRMDGGILDRHIGERQVRER